MNWRITPTAPLTLTAPSVAWTSPASMRSRVVLPAPFGPTIAAVVPSVTLKDASSSSCLPSGSTWLTCATSTCPTRRTVPGGESAWQRVYSRVTVAAGGTATVTSGRLALQGRPRRGEGGRRQDLAAAVSGRDRETVEQHVHGVARPWPRGEALQAVDTVADLAGRREHAARGAAQLEVIHSGLRVERVEQLRGMGRCDPAAVAAAVQRDQLLALGDGGRALGVGAANGEGVVHLERLVPQVDVPRPVGGLRRGARHRDPIGHGSHLDAAGVHERSGRRREGQVTDVHREAGRVDAQPLEHRADIRPR